MNKRFDKNREGTGTREWSDSSYNIQMGCEHGCLYCYARERALRFKQIDSTEQWKCERIREKAVNRKWSKKNGVIMFPTTHDITPGNIDYVITTLKNMLTPGNQVLIVSKPHLNCIQAICGQLSSFKQQIMFRFTIGSMNPSLCEFWEPGAPKPYERTWALKYAFDNGFQTSVSMEPMLSGCDDAIFTFNALSPYVTDTIWIGKMNKIWTRVDMSVPENRAAAYRIEFLQKDSEIIRLVDALKDEPRVRWKDSIKQVIERANGGMQG